MSVCVQDSCLHLLSSINPCIRSLMHPSSLPFLISPAILDVVSPGFPIASLQFLVRLYVISFLRSCTLFMLLRRSLGGLRQINNPLQLMLGHIGRYVRLASLLPSSLFPAMALFVAFVCPSARFYLFGTWLLCNPLVQSLFICPSQRIFIPLTPSNQHTQPVKLASLAARTLPLLSRSLPFRSVFLSPHFLSVLNLSFLLISLFNSIHSFRSHLRIMCAVHLCGFSCLCQLFEFESE